MEQIEHLFESLRVLPHVAALAFAYMLALPIGWDRERNERSAGLRTFPLVAVASCGFVQATEGITGSSPEAQARIVEGLITGIGFIGGGAIIKQSGAVQGRAGNGHSGGPVGNGGGRSCGWPWQLRRRNCGHPVHDLHLPRPVPGETAENAWRRYWPSIGLLMKWSLCGQA
jgi:hypothetical protein